MKSLDNKEKHLDVYEDRYELYQDDGKTVFWQGSQDDQAKKRYDEISSKFKDGYFDEQFKVAKQADFSQFSLECQQLLKEMVDGITSEVGRALVGLTCLQLAVKSIAPEQSIRLHKGNKTRGKFSWVEGISMRSLDRNYNTPFLRRNNLLNLNKDGVFMTRSLAENYPYSALYKAEMKGPFKFWIKIVDAIESDAINPRLGLLYLICLLQNRSEIFRQEADKACSLYSSFKGVRFETIKELISNFYNDTDYSARAFEVTIHAFYQALNDINLLEDMQIIPLSQMRSANKKHGNVGDIELSDSGDIVKAWDAKYGKPYLRDELEELRDKLNENPSVQVAGFICNTEIDKRQDIITRKEQIEQETGTAIFLLSFDEWIEHEFNNYSITDRDNFAFYWFRAIVESFSQKRIILAPIDEPCDAWVKDLIRIMEMRNRI